MRERVRPREATLVAAAVATAALLLVGFAVGYFDGGRVDDSYIFFRYADHLAAGLGFVWNPAGPPTAGATSVAYPLLLAGLAGVAGLPAATIADLVGLAAGVAMLGMVALAVWRAAGPGARWLAAPIVLQLALTPAVIRHALNGMETGLAMAAVAALAWACLGSAPRRAGAAALLGALAGATYLVRPDLPLLCGGLAGLAVVLAQPTMRSRAPLLALLAGFAASVGLAVAGHAWLFGTPVPLAAHMKIAPLTVWTTPVLAEWTVNSLAHFVTLIAVPLVLIAALLTLLGRLAGRISLMLALPALAYTLYLLSIAPVMGFDHRFHMPLVPLIAILLGHLAARAWQARPPGLLRVAPARLGLTLLLGVFVGHQLGAFTEMRGRASAALDGWDAYAVVGERLKPWRDEVTLAASESGLAPYLFGGRHLDLAGLNDATVARLAGTPDATERFRRYLETAWGLPDVWVEPGAQYAYAHLAAHPRLRPLYATVSLAGLQVHVRRDGPHFAEIVAALERAGPVRGAARAWDRRFALF